MRGHDKTARARGVMGSLVLVVTSAACPGPSPTDAGSDAPTACNPADASVPDSQSAPVDGGLPADFFPAPPPAFGTTDNDPRTVQVSASGEALAEAGYDYSAMPAMGAPVFVDGWEVRFDRYLVVIGNVRLTLPGSDPTMRGVLGAEVARASGPWVVDLHKQGPITGAGGAPETAVPLLVFRAPACGGTFDPTVRLAFSYEQLPANTPGLRNANLVAADRDAVETMVRSGWSTYFSGTATYRGRAPSAAVDPTFQSYPTSVRFAFGFRAPTAYVNCHNPALGEMDTPANRGVQPDATRAVRAQITMHTDHLFWDQANVEGAPLHFDPIAARAAGGPAGDGGAGDAGGGAAAVTLADLAGVNPAQLVDRAGRAVMDRGAQTSGYSGSGRLAFQTNGAAGVTDLRDFVVFNQRAGGHLNSDGLCAVQPTGPVGF